MSYKELQQALKSMRQDGCDVQVKLNSSRDVLQAELDRIKQSLMEDVPADVSEAAIAEAPLAEIQTTVEPTDDYHLSTLSQPTAIALEEVAEPLSEAAASGSRGGLRKLHKNTWWIDGTELVMHLDQTQAQAMRNLEDGFRWLGQLGSNIQAFHDGLRQGWQAAKRSHKPRDVAKVIQLDPRKRSLKVA